MTEDVVKFADYQRVHPSDIACALRRIDAIFAAIDYGELLSALPDCEIARDRHAAAVALLALARIEVISLCEHVER